MVDDFMHGLKNISPVLYTIFETVVPFIIDVLPLVVSRLRFLKPRTKWVDREIIPCTLWTGI